MKFRVLYLFLSLVLVAAGLFSMSTVGFAADLDSESLIEGQGDPVAPNNSGVLNFSTGFADTQPRLVKTGNPLDTYWEIQGWLWNSNLGWISMSCDGGDNLGLPCGTTEYSVKVDKATGQWYGWAWGDNTGWVSFGCVGGDNDGTPCGTEEYASTFITDYTSPEFGDIEPAPGDAYSHWAWADSVGWFNLENLHADMLHMIIDEVDGTGDPSDFGDPFDPADNGLEDSQYTWVKVESNASGGPHNAPFTKVKSPYADDSETYSIYMNLADTNGNKFISGGGVSVFFTLNWSDSVDNDQINKNGSFNNNNDGAVEKIFDAGGMPYDAGASSINGITGLYTADFTSKAPTDGVNCSDDTCWSYKEIYNAFEDADLGIDELALDSVEVIIKINSGTPEEQSVTFDMIPLGGSNEIEFKPAIELVAFDFLQAIGADPMERFELLRNVPGYLDIVKDEKGTFNETIDLELQADDSDVNLIFADPIPEGAEGEEAELDLGRNSTTLDEFMVIDDYPVTTQVLGYSTQASTEFVGGPKARSIITYTNGGDTVSYPSNGLPRTGELGLRTQTAEILSGQVNARGDTNLREDAVITSVGTVTTNTIRDAIYEQVVGYTSGAPDKIGEATLGCTIGGDLNVSGGLTLQDDKLIYFDLADRDIDLNLDFASDECLTESDITVVVEGGDVYIDSNYISATGNNIGIVVLEKGGDGGNVYVKDDVTDLVGFHLYSDGTFFRYTTGIGYCGSYREPNFAYDGYCGTFYSPITTLENQFFMRGSLVSNNCLGCSAEAPVYIGTGEILPNLNLENLGRARLYDLHYFAYYDGDGAHSVELPAAPAPNAKEGPVYFDYAEPRDLLLF